MNKIEEEAHRVVTITFNRDGVLAPAIRSAQLATEMVKICHPAIETADLGKLPEIGFFGVAYQGHKDATIARMTYQAWLVAKAFQELATGLRSTLEQAYIFPLSLKLGRQVDDWGSFEKGYAGIERKAQRMNFPDLLSAVQLELGTDLHFRDELISLQKARNCLEHRGGVVGDLDCEAGDALVLRLPRLKIFTRIDNEEVEVYRGQYVEKETVISIKRKTRVRTYAKGQKVEFSPSEFSEIAHSIHLIATDIGPKLPT
jgi:hypothetical protein